MSELTITGTVVDIMQKQQVTDSFAKREFVLKTDDQYPQTIKLEFSQDKCDKLDKVAIGQNVKVHFNVRGRKWHNAKKNEDVYFTTLSAWRIESLEGANQDVPPMEEQPAIDPNDDELPF